MLGLYNPVDILDHVSDNQKFKKDGVSSGTKF